MRKTITYIPSYSFFGRLFHHGEEIKVIDSCNQGLDQHSIHSWLLNEKGFIEGELDEKGIDFFNKADEFVRNLGIKNTKKFIEALFSLLQYLNLKNMTDIKEIELNQYVDAFFNFHDISLKEKLEIVKFIQLMSTEMKNAKDFVHMY